ncbi:substrate-binding domain-containing protein [Mesorhizobium sp. ES1-1]|uniref:substrate-binding domain-containing protein n=1 Tax=Mesorhizobium sp. ES1-1 TaxID=2876629 RepID=UPI001CCF2A56|nr:substrate-binding domain-containing protein [Mesorhizobium sp. ES1-1]MBZ9674681.1 substrate-binding domain-containing protein [Mesorhizobium sp. ES1-1]
MNFKTVCAGLAALAISAITVGTAPSHAEDKKPYTIYLSNNFVGNDWRQQMERVATVSVSKGPLKGRVDLKIENVENTVQAQINSLNNIIRQKPDAILVDAGSDSALNPTIKKACDAGIVVISFDQVVTEPCAFAVASDWDRIPSVMAEWMAKQLGGKGNIILDRGLAGAPISAQLQQGYEKVLAKYPDIKVVGYYNGNYALGPEQSGVAALLAANPKIDGIMTQGYGSGAIQALKDAGRPIVPVVGFSYNVAAVTCAQTQGAKCILGSNPAYLSSEAIKLAVEILDTGKKPADRSVSVKGDFVTTDPFESQLYPGTKMIKIAVGENAFPDQAPGLTLPITPDWVEITAAEAAGSK